MRGEDIRQLLVEQFGVTYTLNGLSKLLKRLDMVWVSARPVSPNANRAGRAEFQKKLSLKVQATVMPFAYSRKSFSERHRP